MKILSYTFALLILFSISLWSETGDPISYEPLDSWMYESYEIAAHGILPDFVNLRPYLRDRFLSGCRNTSSNPVVRWELNRLQFEKKYRHYNSLVDSTTRMLLRVKLSPYSYNTFEENAEPLYRIGFRAESVVSINNNAFIQFRGRVENKGELDSYAKVHRWKEKLTLYVDYALLGYKYKSFLFTFGRTFRSWGPRDSDRLLISDNSPAFNQLSLEFQSDKFMFQFWTARLDSWFEPDSTRFNRYISAHRAAYKPHPRLELGVSETVLYARREAGMELYYLNPILPYYLEQWNNRIDDNIYWQMDFMWYARDGIKLWGEFLIDDFQIDFVSEPHQIGFNFGISELGLFLSRYLQIEIDYTQIRNTVYGQNKPYNSFSNEGVVIGSSLGTDSDRLRYVFTAHLAPCLRIKAGGSITRKGEGRFYDTDNYPAPKGEKFPSGIVETRFNHYVRAEILYNNRIESYITCGYEHFENVDNSSYDEYSPYISVNLNYHLNFISKLH